MQTGTANSNNLELGQCNLQAGRPIQLAPPKRLELERKFEGKNIKRWIRPLGSSRMDYNLSRNSRA